MAKPVPAPEILELQGRKPHVSRAATPAFVGGRPKMPKHLTSPVAQAEWRRMLRELSARGTATRIDGSVLELYVQIYARARECQQKIGADFVVEVPVLDSNGQIAGYKQKPNVLLAVLERCEQRMTVLLSQLGATPASRKSSQITKPKKKQEAPQLDEGDAFLAGVLPLKPQP